MFSGLNPRCRGGNGLRDKDQYSCTKATLPVKCGAAPGHPSKRITGAALPTPTNLKLSLTQYFAHVLFLPRTGTERRAFLTSVNAYLYVYSAFSGACSVERLAYREVKIAPFPWRFAFPEEIAYYGPEIPEHWMDPVECWSDGLWRALPSWLHHNQGCNEKPHHDPMGRFLSPAATFGKVPR